MAREHLRREQGTRGVLAEVLARKLPLAQAQHVGLGARVELGAGGALGRCAAADLEQTDQRADGAAANRGRRVEREREARRGQAQGRTHGGFVAGQVAARHQAAVELHLAHEARRQIALIEGARALARDGLVGAFQPRNSKELAGAGRSAVGQQAAATCRLAIEDVAAGHLEPARHDRRATPSIPRELQRGCHHLLKGEPPVSAVGTTQGREQTRHRDGAVTHAHGDTVAIGQVRLALGRRGRSGGSALAGHRVGALDQLTRAALEPQHQKARAAKRAHQHLAQGGGQRGTDRDVDRVAALEGQPLTDGGGLFVAGGDRGAAGTAFGLHDDQVGAGGRDATSSWKPGPC